MRLLQSVLATLPQTKKPQRKFITHLLGLVLMLPGHATFRNLSRYSSYHERSFARWYDRPFDFVALNKAAITQVMAPEHQQALVIDASFIPKSGTHTYGLERFWNSRQRRSEKGLEVSAIAWLDITDNCAYGLSSTLYEFGQVSACNRPIASSPADRPEGFLPTRYRALMLKNTRPSTGAAVPLPKRR